MGEIDNILTSPTSIRPKRKCPNEKSKVSIRELVANPSTLTAATKAFDDSKEDK